MSTTTNLLIEIGMEELPTRAVNQLASAGQNLWRELLSEAGIPCAEVESFATPRRLAWRLREVALKQPDQDIERKGPAMKAAKDADGQWTKAAEGFARSCGVAPEDLSIVDTPKGQWLMYYGREEGQDLQALLPEMFAEVMNKLPIAKRMRWGNFDQSFVRPVLSLVVLADQAIWPMSFFGVDADRYSLGHRVHHPEPVAIGEAMGYEATLNKAFVMVDAQARTERIREQVSAAAAQLNGEAVMPEALLEEVASLVEWPVAVTGHFEPSFLEVPQEVLITTMQDNQKTFAVVDQNGALQPHFIAVANIESLDPEVVREGNEKVIRPRFADAAFFWEQDLKKPLASHQEQLAKVVYQEQLGSLADKSARVAEMATALAPVCDADAGKAKMAAVLAKCDLLSEMVMEFPELQGLMGRYYAERDGLDAEVAAALEEQYFPLQAGGALPETRVGLTLALAEKFDTLIGGFAIGAKPTGSRDPYALRRMAIGVIRLIIEADLSLPLNTWLANSAASFPAALNAEAQVSEVREYIIERLQGYYREQGVAVEVFQAVRALELDDLEDINQRVKALAQFVDSASAPSLLASAKRIRNILKKQDMAKRDVEVEYLQEPAEQALYDQWQQITPL
ncbi:glycine--tRNA ligase subunit beta [Suttonella sp. R2A3]|uniref:glycine--tRNA ligase subunit beta n=1 Tax=Suttonella sp. R2A3 TaxID=2908648 RepID=UPI001F40C816|nr:glycine--tRNA ligase subunit beta [Suttonella sp. R2A3]UJF23824.1 glycine--tRNA ligase subunit beta [Suttonella sp. R2A3]